MRKRQKFIIASAVLSLGLLAIQWVPIDFRYVAVFAFSIVTYLISAFVLLDDLKGVEWFTILILPTLYSTAIGLFYFLLPEGFISRVIILSLFGIGMYALYLTENIYSVAAVRTIQLLRAAHAVGFLISLLTLILLYNTIFSLRWPFWANALLVFVASLAVLLQGFWSIKLQRRLSLLVWYVSVAIAIVLSQVAMALSFLPMTVWASSLLLATLVYVCLGLMQHALHERLFQRTVYEYVGVGLFVLVAALAVTPWK